MVVLDVWGERWEGGKSRKICGSQLVGEFVMVSLNWDFGATFCDAKFFQKMENEVEVATESDDSSKTEEYVVKSGDTLESIAMRFDVPVSWLKQSNRIFANDIVPGDSLMISPVPPQAVQLDPIDVQLYDPEQKRPNIKGKLFLFGDCLRFEPAVPKAKPVNINIIGCLECGVMPHPRQLELAPDNFDRDDALYLLIVTYLKDPYDPSELAMSHFQGTREDLQRFSDTILKRAEFERKQKKYVPPNPNDIHVSYGVQSVPKNMFVAPPEVALPVPVMRRPRTVSQLPEVKLLGGKSQIITPTEMLQIRKSLPMRFRFASWQLLFQLSRDGTSYTTFYEKTQRRAPVILVLKTDQGEKIGAYVSNGLKISRRYYGSGETFIFGFTPDYAEFHWTPKNSNQYFISSDRDEIAIGGGSAVAIWLDGEFRNGISEPCPTYNSPSLTMKSHFKIIDVEVWSIGSL